MTMYWPQRERDRDFIAAPADPGTLDFMSTQAELALYHSPIWSIARLVEQDLERRDWGEANNFGARISPEEANERFGLGGLLTFDRDITPGEAQLLMKRKINETRRMHILSTGSTTLGRKVLGFGTSLATTILDPVNAVSMFVPIVGEVQFARLLKSVGGSITAARAARGVIEGFTGALMVEPFILLPAYTEQSYYSLHDSSVNLGFGAILGGALQAGLGKLGDRISGSRTKNLFLKNMATIDDYIKRLPAETQDDLMRMAISDVIGDRPVTSPSEIIKVDETAIRRELRFDAREARRQAIAELGFDMDQPDTFNLYPDKSIPDPKLNEPWFHGRMKGPFTFRKGVSYFARDIDFALAFGGENPQRIFVANLEIKNPMTEADVFKVANEFGQKRFDKGEFGTVPEEGDVPSAFDNPEFIKFAESKGFDGYIGSHVLGEPEGGIMAVVFSSGQIRTPGRKSVKTKTGVQWDPAIESARTLDQRVKDLQKGRIKNLIAKKRREFAQELKLRDVEPIKVDDAHAFDKPGIEKEIATIDEDVRLLEESLGIEEAEVTPKVDIEEITPRIKESTITSLGEEKVASLQRKAESIPDTFNLYPDKSIADPKPNEPWFHGRQPDQGIPFKKGRIAWFTRDPDYAGLYVADPEIRDVRPGLKEDINEVFVANLELKSKIATFDDLKRIVAENEEFEFFLGTEFDPQDALNEVGIVDLLKEEGFNSYIGKERDIDIAAVFSPDQIKPIKGKLAKATRKIAEVPEETRITTEDQLFIDEQMRDFDNFDNDQRAIQSAIDCVIKGI